MSQAPPFPDIKALSDDLYQQWEASMTTWWDQVLDSQAFLDASGKGVAETARARARYEQQVDETLTRMHLPTRGDLTRLARIATLLEKRLLEMEDRLLEIQDSLAERDAAAARMERELVQARIEAAEARLEQRAQLSALLGRLEALEGAAPAAPAPKGRRAPGPKA